MQLNLRILWPKGKMGNEHSNLGSRAQVLGYNGVVSATPCEGTFWIRELRTLEEIEGVSADFFLWTSRWKEGDFFSQPGNERWTRKELIALEMEKLESKLCKAANRSAKLIFCLPGEEKLEWVAHLSKMAGPKTYLAFSPYLGDSAKDFLPPQPIWRKIAEGEEFCATPLLPILNTGMVDQGGGLWPTLPFDLYDRFYSHIPSSFFKGALTLTPVVPHNPGFLHCALSVGAQLLQKEDSPEKKLAEWFLQHKSKVDYFSSAMLLRHLRTLALETTFLRHLKPKKIGSEESRALLDGLSSKIHALQFSIEREHPHFLDPFLFFVRDARRIMSFFASQMNVSHSTHPDESLESFWTHKVGGSVAFREEPLRGGAGSKQESIFMENWG